MTYISSCLYEDGGEHLAAADGYIPVYSDNMAIEALALGIVSLCLTFVNIFCIVLMGIIVLKVCLIHILPSLLVVSHLITQFPESPT